MPTYAFHCDACDHAFDKILSISSRLEPTEQPCPECGVLQVKQSIGIGGFKSSRLDMKKVPQGFKDVLNKIKERNHRSEISI